MKATLLLARNPWLPAGILLVIDRLLKAAIQDAPNGVSAFGLSVGRQINVFGTLGIDLSNRDAALLGAAVAALAGWWLATHRGTPALRVSAWLVLVGALSNVLDRAVFGGVVDLFSFGRLPRFNLADAMITGGIILIVLQEVRGGHRRA